MPRKQRKVGREIGADAIYNSVLVSKFINKLMLSGKKSVAEKIVYQSLQNMGESLKDSPLKLYEQVIKNVMPVMEVKSRRIGGSNYQVPVEVRKARSVSLGMRWLIDNARKRAGKGMIEKLSKEMIEAYNGTGASVKKKDDIHKMAEANRAFAHFR